MAYNLTKGGTVGPINSDVPKQCICTAVRIRRQAFSDGIAAASGRIHILILGERKAGIFFPSFTDILLILILTFPGKYNTILIEERTFVRQ
ncbi:hypothetical protein DWW31_04980 [Clostridium sp. AF15-17LB]|nr:hypothetical protein DWW31_04980 [Clostridium sp. AF15-17LB]